MPITRREILSLFPISALPAGLLLNSWPVEAEPSLQGSPQEPLPTAMYPFDKLPVRSSNGAQIRHILKGKLATGESIEVHETTLPPGGMPHAAHRHVHSEMWLIREGTVEITVNGKPTRLGPGSLGFVHSNEEHGIKNVGDQPALYFVVAVGPAAAA